MVLGQQRLGRGLGTPAPALALRPPRQQLKLGLLRGLLRLHERNKVQRVVLAPAGRRGAFPWLPGAAPGGASKGRSGADSGRHAANKWQHVKSDQMFGPDSGPVPVTRRAASLAGHRGRVLEPHRVVRFFGRAPPSSAPSSSSAPGCAGKQQGGIGPPNEPRCQLARRCDIQQCCQRATKAIMPVASTAAHPL